MQLSAHSIGALQRATISNRRLSPAMGSSSSSLRSIKRRALPQQSQQVADSAALHGTAAASQPSGALLQAALQAAASHPASLTTAAAVLLWVASSEPCSAAEAVQHSHSNSSLFDLAEGEEFWGNVAKYGRYFVTVMLGTGYVMVQPLVAAFKKPVTAAVALVAIVGGSVLLKFTLDAMLGIQEPFSYEPGSIAPYQ